MEGTKTATNVQVVMTQVEPKHQLKTLSENTVRILEHIE